MRFASIREKILGSRTIAVVGHVNPDGDCIGSLLAVGLGLAGIGKRVHMLLQDNVPGRYRFLPGADKIKKTLKNPPDLAISVDCNSKQMIGRPLAYIAKAKNILEIDHHAFREPFGSLSLIDSRAASVGEIIYKLLGRLGIQITGDIAQNILTSIIVETNSFRLPSVKPYTFLVCSELLRSGLDFTRLSELVYWSKSRESAILGGICMARLKFASGRRIAWSMLGMRDFSRVGGGQADVDAVANDILAIDSVKIAVFFRETRNGRLRVSIRSKGGINIALLAYHYGGGGHFDSAGCYIDNNNKARAGFLNRAKALAAGAAQK